MGDDFIIIDAATLNMDESEGAQAPRNSYKHAMRNGVNFQSDAEARALANNFVRENLTDAENLLCSCNKEDYLQGFGP